MPNRLPTLLAAFAALVALSAGRAEAGFVSGKDLQEICKADQVGAGDPLRSAECVGFIMGVSDTFDCTETLHGFRWNSPDKPDQHQMVKVVETWLDRHQHSLHYEADGLVAAALAETFPCR